MCILYEWSNSLTHEQIWKPLETKWNNFLSSPTLENFTIWHHRIQENNSLTKIVPYPFLNCHTHAHLKINFCHIIKIQSNWFSNYSSIYTNKLIGHNPQSHKGIQLQDHFFITNVKIILPIFGNQHKFIWILSSRSPSKSLVKIPIVENNHVTSIWLLTIFKVWQTKYSIVGN